MQTINIYQLEELTEQAQQKAHEEFINSGRDFFPWDEAKATIEKALSHFNCEFDNYRIDFSNHNLSSYTITMPAHYMELEYVRLYKLLVNNFDLIVPKYSKDKKRVKLSQNADCPFTGVCYDIDFLEPYKNFLKKPTNITFEELMRECVANVLRSLENEYEYQQTFEYFKEHSEANSCMYLEDGREY